MKNSKYSSFAGKIWKCLPCRIGAIIAGIIAGLFLAAIILVDPILNRIVKPKILQSVNSNKNLYLKIDDFSYSFFGNSLSSYNVELNNYSSSGKINVKIPEVYSSSVPWFNIIFGKKGMSLGKILLDNPEILIEQNETAGVDSAANDTSSQSNEFLSRKMFEDLPEQLNPFLIDQLEIVNGSLVRVMKNGKPVRTDSVKNISLNINGIFLSPELNDSLKLKYADTFFLNVENIHSKMHESGYDLRVERIELSSNDSTLSIKSFTYKSFLSVQEYFSRRQYRSDKNDISFPEISISGFNLSEFFWNKIISAKKITADDFYVEIMTNKRKSLSPDYKAEMPHEIVKDLGFDLNVREISTVQSKLVVKELWPHTDQPSYLDFTQISAKIFNISSLPAYQSEKYPAIINASGKVADAGKITVKLEVPLLADRVKFSYEGNMGKMEAAKLNSHMEVADLSKITSGSAENVEFSVKAEGDTARANVIPIYNNLEIEVLDEDGDKDITESVKSFIANNVVIRKSNPDDEGKIKSGNVSYKLKKTDAFLDYIWLVLRNGLGEVVGF